MSVPHPPSADVAGGPVDRYHRILESLGPRGPEDAGLIKSLSELVVLLELTVSLGADPGKDAALEAALLGLIGELRTGRGAVFVRGAGGALGLRASRGLRNPPDAPLSLAGIGDLVQRGQGNATGELDAWGLDVLCPVMSSGRPVAALGVGARVDGQPHRLEDLAFLRSAAACLAAPLDNALMRRELERVNRRLGVKIYQLDSLFDVSRELSRSLERESIHELVVATLMGHLVVSRCALLVPAGDRLEVALARGVPARGLPPEVGREALAAATRLTEPTAVAALPAGPLREGLGSLGLAWLVPLGGAGSADGLLAVGEPASGASLAEEERHFAATLARQAQAALEGLRLHDLREEKRQRDWELQIAREIQQSLFPRQAPALENFEISAQTRPCRQVGGDYYDFVPLGAGRVGVVVADVVGKSTPASLLMASVHAFLRALAGSVDAAALAQRLNAFLLESTADNRYVTLFYAEIDPAQRRLAYVNAGHVRPVLLRSGGATERLESGGPVLGLLENARYDVGQVWLDPGDLLVATTDGANEAENPAGEEFGERRLVDVLRSAGAAPAEACVGAVISAVLGWTGPAGCADDLTVLVARAN